MATKNGWYRFSCVLSDADDRTRPHTVIVRAASRADASARLTGALASGEFSPWQYEPDSNPEMEDNVAIAYHACTDVDCDGFGTSELFVIDTAPRQLTRSEVADIATSTASIIAD